MQWLVPIMKTLQLFLNNVCVLIHMCILSALKQLPQKLSQTRRTTTHTPKTHTTVRSAPISIPLLSVTLTETLYVSYTLTNVVRKNCSLTVVR